MRCAISFPGCHRRGGVERVMLECANFLARRGHEVHAFASEWDVASLDSRVIRQTVKTLKQPQALAAPLFLRESQKMIKALRPAPDAVASFGVSAPEGSVVWMQSVHAAWIKISSQTRTFAGRFKQRMNPFHPVILQMEKDLLRGRRYRKVIALTPQVQKDIEDHYGVPSEDITVLPNGFSADEFNVVRGRARRAQIREKFDFREEHKVAVFVANELERKGFFRLLEAVARLREPGLRVLAAGRFDPAPARAEISRLGLQKVVLLSGAANDIADFYAAADFFVLPTKYEAWGLVIVEALASGLPVITSRSAGAAVAVHDGRTGLLLENPMDSQEIATALGRALEHSFLAPEDIAATVAHLEWGRVLVEYEQALKRSAPSHL